MRKGLGRGDAIRRKLFTKCKTLNRILLQGSTQKSAFASTVLDNISATQFHILVSFLVLLFCLTTFFKLSNIHTSGTLLV